MEREEIRSGAPCPGAPESAPRCAGISAQVSRNGCPSASESVPRCRRNQCPGATGIRTKRDLALPRALRKLDAFEVIVLDDLGYVQQSADEVEVLFTLMAERYERRSMIITSNLVFGEWDRIFKNPMTTAAAIDRLVHHSVILEFDGPSIRAEEAKKRNPKKENAHPS